jgi:hypothetical protein
MAQGSLWGALAMADLDALDWPTVRGLALRHLRWWSERPISDRDGVLSVGYAYDNRRMCESYNSAGSPYWCMKAFTMLAAPDDHPFWVVDEAEHAVPVTVTLPTAGMVLGRDEGQVVALFAQRPGWSFVEQAEAKYHKFCYSSRFGFSGDFALYGMTTTDSMLAVTDPATGVRAVRAGVQRSEVDEGVALTRWSPLPGVVVDTALTGGAPWHVRLHRISTDRELALSETGFALPREPEGFSPRERASSSPGSVTATSEYGASTIVDLARAGSEPRRADILSLSPNANLMHPHTVVPVLTTTVFAGITLVACAVGASHDGVAVAANAAADMPDGLIQRLEAFTAAADAET